LRRQLYLLAIIGLAASFLGAAIGWFAQESLMQLLGSLIRGNLPAPSIWPMVWSIIFALLLLMGFAGPPMLTLSQISPLRLVRREFGKVPFTARSMAFFGFISCLALIFWATRDWKLLLWVTICFGAGAILFAALAYAGLWSLSRFAQSNQLANIGFALRFAISAQSRRAAFAMIQVSSLALAIMALLLIFLLRQDLLQSWQANVPVDAPNRFLINIQNDQRQAVRQMLDSGGVGQVQLYPMVRGRLTQINGREVMPDQYQSDNAKRLVDREFNLSYTSIFPEDNQLVSGRWFGDDGKPQISIESGIAKTLGLSLGDQMSFDIAGQTITAPITSMRKLDWGSMQVNFFVIFPPEALKSFPQSWITSYHQAKNLDSLDIQLAQRYPNLTIVDIDNSLRQIQEVLNRLANALGLLLAFTLCAAVLVLFAVLGSTQDDRFRDAALLKAMGTSKKTLRQLVFMELATIGLLSGLLGGLAASVSTWALGRYLLEIEFYSFASAIALGMLIGLLVSLIAGAQLHRKIQSASTMDCLRAA
jgi:putative ABC transport system permease protein